MRSSLSSARPGEKRFAWAGGAAVLIVCLIGVGAYVNRPPTLSSSSYAASSLTVPTVKLNSGYDIPLLGLGTFRAKGKDAYDAIISGVQIGYKHIDTAAAYGNEEQIGAALAKLFKDGTVQREELWITTKLWSNNHAQDMVEPALRESLGKLQLDYVDLYLVHWPLSDRPGPVLDPPMEETWAGMEGVADKGLALCIGISNFSPEKIQRWFKNARIPPAVNQIEMHPNWRNGRVLDFCREHGIHVTAYAPLSSPATTAAEQQDVPNLMKDPTVIKIAEAHNRTPQQVLLQWGIQHGDTQHVSVIPKSSNPEHQRNNFGAVDRQLSEADFNAISGFQKQIRYFSGEGMGFNKQGPYYTYRDLWDEDPVN